MQNNLGYFYYKRLYSNTNNELEINTQNKKILLDRTISEQEKIYSIENPDFLKLYTTYPGLTTGTGMPHGIKDVAEDFKIGFYFDHTTGLPLIPGSSVKGTLRSAFPVINKITKDDGTTEFVFDKKTNEKINEVKAGWINALLKNLNDPDFLNKHYEPEETSPEDIANIYLLTLTIFEGVKDHSKSDPRDKFYSIYKRDIFYDAIITAAGKNGKILGTDSITPHIKKDMPYHKAMLKNPVPLLFLKVLPKVEFTFNFSLTENGLSKANKIKLFKHILLTIGIGAKTNVGYGQFKANDDETNSDKHLIKNKITMKDILEKEKEAEITKSEADKHIIKDAILECKIIKKEKGLYYFRFDWDQELEFTKKIDKVKGQFETGDIVKIIIVDNYYNSKLVDFSNTIEKV